MPRVRIRRNQLTLPDDLRQALGAADEDEIDAAPVDEGVLLKPSPEARRAGLADVRAAQAGVRLSPELEAMSPEEAEQAIAERDRVLRTLRAHEPEIRARGVTRLRLFGSMARGEAGPESDVDLLAEVDPDAKFSLLDLAGLQLDLGDLLGRPVHVATSLERARPRIRQRIEADLIEVF